MRRGELQTAFERATSARTNAAGDAGEGGPVPEKPDKPRAPRDEFRLYKSALDISLMFSSCCCGSATSWN